MAQGVRGRRLGLAVGSIALWAVASAGQAQSTVEVLSDQAQILKRFPKDAGLIAHGARVRLQSGDWLEITDNPFGKAPPVLCWYAPALHVAGICQTGAGVAVTTLIELHTGRRVSAPGVAKLMSGDGLIAVGPDRTRGVDADSVTVVQVQPDDIVDEGGALFDGDYGAGAWVDGDCYRLTAKTHKGGAWLEKTADGWRQISAAQSTVCQKRHGG